MVTVETLAGVFVDAITQIDSSRHISSSQLSRLTGYSSNFSGESERKAEISRAVEQARGGLNVEFAYIDYLCGAL